MKKIAIISAGAIALTMLPASGVFAAGSVTDTVTVTIASSCTYSSGIADDTKTLSISNGSNKSTSTRPMTFNCNNAGGWKITAIGAGAGSDVTKMHTTTSGATDIATGTGTSGSVWAFKLEGSNVATTYQSWAAIPGTATTVATNTATISGGSITPTYRVYISSTQPAGTYTGKVTYTLTTL